MAKRRSVAGQTVMIVGGSQGIGRATAAELVRRGASVCLVARGAQPLAMAATELGAQCTRDGQFVETLVADATDETTLTPLIEEFVARRGVPDVLVNNVGYSDPRRVTDFVPADYRAALETNFLGQVVPFHALLPHFMATGRGHVVNVSSMIGYFSIMGFATYAPSKFAIVGWTETLRNELKPHGLTFGLLYPPDTLTPGYEKENLHKPAECLQMSAGAKAMTAEAVATVLVDGIERRRLHILPGDAAMVWRLKRHAPRVLNAVLDRSYAKARRQPVST